MPIASTKGNQPLFSNPFTDRKSSRWIDKIFILLYTGTHAEKLGGCLTSHRPETHVLCWMQIDRVIDRCLRDYLTETGDSDPHYMSPRDMYCNSHLRIL